MIGETRIKYLLGQLGLDGHKTISNRPNIGGIASLGVVINPEQLERWFENRFQLENLSKKEAEQIIDYLLSPDCRILFSFSPHFGIGRISLSSKTKLMTNVSLQEIMNVLYYHVFSIFKFDVIKNLDDTFTARIVCTMASKLDPVVNI